MVFVVMRPPNSAHHDQSIADPLPQGESFVEPQTGLNARFSAGVVNMPHVKEAMFDAV